MAQVFVGNFTASAATGTQAVAGVGFTPNVVLFWFGSTNTDGSNVNDLGFVTGVAAGTGGTATASHGGFTLDASSNGADEQRWASSSAILLEDEAGTTVLSFTINSWDADGFTINKATASTATNINFMAMEVDNVGVLTGLTTPTSTGTKDFTGLGFDPANGDLAIVFTGIHTAASYSANNVWHSIGATDGTNQFVFQDVSVIGNPMRGSKSNSDGLVDFSQTANNGGTPGTVLRRAAFSAWITDGFRLNYTVTEGTARYFFAVVLNDAEPFEVANWTTGSGTGSFSFSSLSNQPRAVMLMTHDDAADTELADDFNLAIGAYDGSTQLSHHAFEEGNNGTATSDNYQRFDSSSSLYVQDVTPSVTKDANLSSLTASGFDGNWDTNAGATHVGVIAVGLHTPVTTKGYPWRRKRRRPRISDYFGDGTQVTTPYSVGGWT